MITTIIGQNDTVWFMRSHEQSESFKPTKAEWSVLFEWLQDVLIGYFDEQPSWRCTPLFTSPGGFIAQKLFTR